MMTIGTLLGLGVSGLSLLATIIFLGKLRRSARSAPRFTAVLGRPLTDPSVAVIVPMYNEAVNVEECIRSVLASTDSSNLQVWVVDDRSSDRTLAIAQTLQQILQDPRLHVIAGSDRPAEERWMGKNWACEQAIQQMGLSCQAAISGAARSLGPGSLEPDYLLFIDADVRLKPGAIAAAVHHLQAQTSDLLTFWPTIICGCWMEWLVQPLIASLLAIGYDFTNINDRSQPDAAFAVGPFMLWRRSAYDAIGGHRAVAAIILEDVELAWRVKQAGLRLAYGVGPELATVRMYQSAAALWEGWTKNWHLGARRNLRVTLYIAIMTALVCVPPWVGLIYYLATVFNHPAVVSGAGLLLSGGAIVGHYRIRRWARSLTGIPLRYWWCMGVGGSIMSAIAIASIIKTETGWGWTWRGRSLHNQPI